MQRTITRLNSLATNLGLLGVGHGLHTSPTSPIASVNKLLREEILHGKVSKEGVGVAIDFGNKATKEDFDNFFKTAYKNVDKEVTTYRSVFDNKITDLESKFNTKAATQVESLVSKATTTSKLSKLISLTPYLPLAFQLATLVGELISDQIRIMNLKERQKIKEELRAEMVKQFGNNNKGLRESLRSIG